MDCFICTHNIYLRMFDYFHVLYTISFACQRCLLDLELSGGLRSLGLPLGRVEDCTVGRLPRRLSESSISGRFSYLQE